MAAMEVDEKEELDKIKLKSLTKEEVERQETVFKEFEKYQELNHLKLNENEYHLKCSCRPENGGSGVCGCVLGSKFIVTS